MAITTTKAPKTIPIASVRIVTTNSALLASRMKSSPIETTTRKIEILKATWPNCGDNVNSCWLP